jgi:hypothetical protein
MNWTAFAPDFQALPKNVEYAEKEDEYDVLPGGERPQSDEHEQADVDVTTVESIAAFESDSEGECQVFCIPPEVGAGFADKHHR